MKTILTPIAERLAAKSEPEPNSGCVLWLGASILSGGRRYYGVLGRGRRGEGLVLAHRAAFVAAGGTIEPGKDLMHSCDNTLCINDAHLSNGTRAENMQDCSRKGRTRSGSSLKTHCPQGHAYDEANTGRSMGRRVCRACCRERAREYAARRRVAQC